jgi:hypothetical protein
MQYRFTLFYRSLPESAHHVIFIYIHPFKGSSFTTIAIIPLTHKAACHTRNPTKKGVLINFEVYNIHGKQES